MNKRQGQRDGEKRERKKKKETEKSEGDIRPELTFITHSRTFR